MKTYWFEVIGEDSILCGEQFFVEEEDIDKATAVAETYFPDEIITCYGDVDDFEAEMMGFDTY
jgi:hypothetical protein